MARSPRLVVPGQPLHVIQRGNNRSVTFQSVEDYHRYKRELCVASERAGCAIHAYVLMSNHVHLLVTPNSRDALGSMMQAVGRRYVRYFNDRYERTGTLWEGRFRSALIDSNLYFLTCSRYIELNPVRARITKRPDEYRWSSFRHNAMGAVDPLVTPHPLYIDLASAAHERRASYRALFRDGLEERIIAEIRRATNSCRVLGTTKFRGDVGRALGRHADRLAHGGDRRSTGFSSRARCGMLDRKIVESESTTLTP